MSNNMLFLLNNMIQKDQSAILRPISIFLGYIMDFFFNIAYFLTEPHSLGISIILLTIATRLLMLPLAFSSQKSMSAMQRLQPEIEKVKAKYGDSKDPEVQQKMNMEIQQLYSKNKVNPFGGCLPLIIQMPIFFALSYIMQQSYLFINKLGAVYEHLADIIYSIPLRYNYLVPIVHPKVPESLMPFDISVPENLVKALNKFTLAEWSSFLAQIPPEFVSRLEPVLQQKQNIEFFLGINLQGVAGTAFPGILIPILSALTTFLSSWLMNRQQKTTDQQSKTTQMIMTYGMPIFIGFTTINFSAGVGIYWITSTVFQIFQQMFLNKYYGKDKPADKDKVIDVKSPDKLTDRLKKAGKGK